MALLSSLWLAGCSVFGISDVKEPPYRSVAKLGMVEIREYGPRIVAETTVQAGELAARIAGFRRIAGYIFGGNHTRSTIAMTAPVAQQQTAAASAPVAQAPAAGGWTIRFFMPADFNMRGLPVPDDQAVRLVEVPAQTIAVRRYSGSIAPAAVARETAKLLRGLQGTRWTAAGDPAAWFYDPPWTLPPLRHNEVAVAVRPAELYRPHHPHPLPLPKGRE